MNIKNFYLSGATKAELAGGVSLGCGIASALSLFLLSKEYPHSYNDIPLWLLICDSCMIPISLFLGIGSIPRRLKQARSVSVLDLILNHLRPGVIVSASLSFVITLILAMTTASVKEAPLLILTIIAMTFVPHMLIYINGQEAPFRGPIAESLTALREAPALPGLAPLPSSETSVDMASGAVKAVESPKDSISDQGPVPTPETPKDRLVTLRILLDVTRNRLLEEVLSLARRGNINLGIGIFTTIVAIGLLASVVLAEKVSSKNWTEAFVYYAPRISFAVFVEIFSFFFLRLYKASLEGIRYFQNELTNLELRFISIEIALLGEPTQTLGSLISELAKTERNFLLKEGEATIELRRAEIETRSYKEALGTLSEIVKGLNVKS